MPVRLGSTRDRFLELDLKHLRSCVVLERAVNSKSSTVRGQHLATLCSASAAAACAGESVTSLGSLSSPDCDQ